MAGSVNKVILIGNLGNDPEVKYFDDESCIANLSLATNRRYKNRAGEQIDETEWHRVVLRTGLAKVAEKYLKRGDSCYIEGRLRTRKWTDQTGNDRYTTEIIAEEMTMLGGRGDGAPAPRPAAQPSQSMPASGANGASTHPQPSGDDDLPF